MIHLKSLGLTLAFLSLISSNAFTDEPAPPKFYDLSHKQTAPPPPKTAQVKDIVAINILKIENEDSIRLLGIEPSKKVEVRRKAIEYLLSEIKGKTIQLEYDKRLRDNVGRLMAYAFLVDKNGTPAEDPLQEELLWRGYAYASAKYPCKRLKRFKRYEKAAKKEKHGLWEGN